MEFKNESGLIFKEISSEKKRTYVWSDGASVTIEDPLMLHVSKSGGHRIFDAAKRSHYIPPTWIHLYWEVYEGMPNFVK